MSSANHDLEMGQAVIELRETVDGLVEELALEAAKKEAEEKEARRKAFQEEKRLEAEAAEDEGEDGPSLNQILMFIAALTFGVLFIIGWTVVYNKVLDLEQMDRDIDARLTNVTANSEFSLATAQSLLVARAKILAFSDISTESNLAKLGGIVTDGVAHDLTKTVTTVAGDSLFLTTAGAATGGSLANNALKAMATGGARMLVVPGVNDLKLGSVADLEALFAASTTEAAAGSTGSLTWLVSNIKRSSDSMNLASTTDYVVLTIDGVRFGFVGLVANPMSASFTWEDPVAAINRIATAHWAHDVLVAVIHGSDADVTSLVETSASAPAALPADIVVAGGSFAYGSQIVNGKTIIKTTGANSYVSDLQLVVRRDTPSLFSTSPMPLTTATATALPAVETAIADGEAALATYLSSTMVTGGPGLNLADVESSETDAGRHVADFLALSAPAAPVGALKVAMIHGGFFAGAGGVSIPAGNFALSQLGLNANDRFVTVTTTVSALQTAMSSAYASWSTPTALFPHLSSALTGTTINTSTGAVTLGATGNLFVVLPESMATAFGLTPDSGSLSASTIATHMYSKFTTTTLTPTSARLTLV